MRKLRITDVSNLPKVPLLKCDRYRTKPRYSDFRYILLLIYMSFHLLSWLSMLYAENFPIFFYFYFFSQVPGLYFKLLSEILRG